MTLNVFLHPKASVKNALEKPNLLISVALVVVFAVLSFATYPLLGAAFPVNDFGISLVKIFIGFFLMAGIFYVVALLFKGKEMKAGFTGVASALSRMYVFFIVSALLTLIAMTFFSPSLMVIGDIAKKEKLNFLDASNLMKIMQNKDESALEKFSSEKALTVDEKNLLDSVIKKSTPLINPDSLFISMAISFIALLISAIGFLLVFAFLVAELLKAGFLKNAIVFVILLVAFGFIGNTFFLW